LDKNHSTCKREELSFPAGTFSTMKSKSLVIRPLGLRGNPMYLPMLGVLETPRIPHKCCLRLGLTLGEKKTLELVNLLTRVVAKILKHSSNSMATTNRSLHTKQEVINKE
jgi:hypothetical protein